MPTCSPARAFSTSTARRSVPPESPDYIHVPRSIQPEQRLPPRIRGTLPVPREIFPAKNPEKLEQQFLEKATRPRKEPFDPRTATQVQIKKFRMAQLRREYLREGLSELRNRKSKIDKQLAERNRIKTAEREQLTAQSEREDERLTSSSVLQGMLSSKGGFTIDPKWEERYRERVAKTKEHSDRLDDMRKDALHTLYMNARDFIVTEEALDAEIDRVFPFDKDPAFRTPSGQGKDIWFTGVPPTVTELLQKTVSPERNISRRVSDIDGSSTTARTASERAKKLAESLSGGKM
ncbi:hypothetical protein UCRPC4_g01970 [Phaeomoniella chlamydospora]|uniref:Uncharacterized protein n=1 Tax=Phaeomoniella chlamydospora TaxID=158046 RepID=A0A0G2ESF9_PHACM|nr:hypothetical protein UCRPC4_g01970 [Phaeomoniella chlamydospora]